MFKNGDSPIDVAIALHLSNEETLRYYKEYLQLTGHYRLLKIAEELGGNFVHFCNTYYAIKKRCLTLADIQKVVNRDRDFEDELASREKLSSEQDEKINEQNETLTYLNIK